MFASPRHPGWPHWHTISVVPFVLSQCGLQKFSPFGGTQLQAGFSHFLGSLIVSLPRLNYLRTDQRASMGLDA